MLHTPSSIFVILKFKRGHLKFSVYGRKQTDKHTYIHTHAHAQCNHASVGLSQARPNYMHVSCIVSEPDPRESDSETISCTGSYNFAGIAHLRKLLMETLQSHMKLL